MPEKEGGKERIDLAVFIVHRSSFIVHAYTRESRGGRVSFCEDARLEYYFALFFLGFVVCA